MRFNRENTRRINVGGAAIGGGAPITVQSMTNTKTEDISATIAQIARLESAGCEIIRVAVPNIEAARAIGEIKQGINIPLVADIHFDYRLALEAIAAGADKIRLNPGNIGSEDRVKAVAEACRVRDIPIRIGVNGGSLERELLDKYGGVTAQAMVDSALAHIRLLHKFDFEDICVSLKASAVGMTVEACRLFAEQSNYPVHLGITEAGGSYSGLVQSAVGMGTLLLDGIGDTLRVSLTADPVEEIRAGIEILKAAELRNDGVRIISCPSCGRSDIDLISLAGEVEKRVRNIDRNIVVAVMGCAVNGPGEARQADFGIAGGKGVGILFAKGKIVGKAPAHRLVDALVELIENDACV